MEIIGTGERGARWGRSVLLAAAIVAAGLGAGWQGAAQAYPLDGFDYTGIRRVLYSERIQTGELNRRKQPHGATLPLALVDTRLSMPGPLTMVPDPAFSRRLKDLIGDQDYAVALLDLSDPTNPVYAELNADVKRNVGSVGKLVVAVAWFQALADALPDVAAREALLRDTVITADEFVISDHHKVILYDPDAGSREFRTLRVGDRGTLWDWLDWMLSASNNAAAAMLQKETLLLDHFGAAYPPTAEQQADYFDQTTYASRGERFQQLMNEAVTRNGMDDALLRQGSLFTRTGKRKVEGTRSYGNVRELVSMLYRMERGELVDRWSSRELKRLMYMTQKRIRYASHPALNDYAVYFKSGSLYSCQPEEGFTCGKYMGNKLNLLASLALVEGPVAEAPDTTAVPMDYHYLVAVSSNVLRVNSAVAHQTLALRIHRMIEARHEARLEAAKAIDVPQEGEGTGSPGEPLPPAELPLR
ncbi:MAG: serine hydrolase [Pseudomonadota bacterium]